MALPPPLNALRAFEAAARRGSYGAAADELGVTPAAIGQQVRHLEEILALSLFDRDGRRLTLTAAGAAGLERLSRGFNLLGEASAAMRTQGLATRLVVAAPADFVAAWLAPRLPGFLKAYPGLALRLVSLDSAGSGEADLAIVFAVAPPTDGRADLWMEDVLTPACRPGTERGIATPADLDGQTLVHDLSAATGWRDWLTARGAYSVDVRGGIEAPDAATAMALASAGAGIALVRRSLAQPLLRSGQLQPVFADGDLAAPERYFLVTPRGVGLSRPAIEATAWLRAEAARFQDAADEL